jgi:transposase
VIWAAAGFGDILLRWKMKPETVHGEKMDIQPGAQVRGGQAGQRAWWVCSPGGQDLDVHENVLRKWVRELRDAPQEAFPGNGKQKAQDAEMARLRKEVARLKIERDILKKAAAYFTKDSM